MSIQLKLLFSVLSVTIVIFGTTIFYIGHNEQQASVEEAKNMAHSYSREYANLVAAELNTNIGLCRSMADLFSNIKTIPSYHRDTLIYNYLSTIMRNNEKIYSAWVSFELSVDDTSYNRRYGRKQYLLNKSDQDSLALQITLLNTDGDDRNSDYYRAKITSEEMVSTPHFIQVNNQQIMLTNITQPIMIDDYFGGLAGIDLSITDVQHQIDELSPFQSGFASLISNDGTFVAFPQKDFVGKPFYTKIDLFTDSKIIEENIKDGKEFSYATQYKGEKKQLSFAPVKFGDTKSPWSIAVFIPLQRIERGATSRLYTMLFSGIISMIALTIMVLFSSSRLIKPLKEITLVLNDLSKGALKDAGKMVIFSKDEIGKIKISANELIDSLNTTASFANEIGKGNYEAEYNKRGDKDTLGKSLLEMRESLKKAKEFDEEAKIESEMRNWSVHGQAIFSELLREHNDDIDSMSYQVISKLVKYMGANQGGLFIVNDDNKDDVFIELKAVYAYERKKLVIQRIEIGENIVGRCVIEEKSIYMTELPEDYISITSGLGEATPTALLVSPLIFNQKVYGVVEIASFDTIEKYKIDFIDKIGESIASTISMLKTNLMTNQLFEEAKIKSQQFEQQKELMSQNNEELTAIKLGLEKKIELLETTIETLKNEKRGLLEKADHNKRMLDLSKNNVDKKESELKKLRGYVERLKHRK